MPFDLAYLKEHKLLIGGIAIVGVVGIYIITRSGGSGAVATSSGIDPTTAALYAQDQQTQAQLQGQQTQIQGQLDLAGLQAQTTQQGQALGAQVQLAGISATQETTDAQTAAAHDLGLAQVASQIQQANDNLSATSQGIAAQLAGLESNNATTTNIAGIAAAEQVGIANLTSQTQVAISNNQTAASIAQTNAGVQIAGIQASTVKTTSLANTASGLIGGAVGLLGAFL